MPKTTVRATAWSRTSRGSALTCEIEELVPGARSANIPTTVRWWMKREDVNPGTRSPGSRIRTERPKLMITQSMKTGRSKTKIQRVKAKEAGKAMERDRARARRKISLVGFTTRPADARRDRGASFPMMVPAAQSAGPAQAFNWLTLPILRE